MATLNVTNTIASPAYPGQSVLVTLDSAESLSIIPQLALGNECTIDNSGLLGTIGWIDTYGHSFKIKPDNPTQSLGEPETTTLAVSSTITITTS